MHGLNTYDYGARQYDPARITWDRMDQLCEKYYHINPYVYCGGNPVNRIDPDGNKIKLIGSSEICEVVVDIYNSGSSGNSPYSISDGMLCVDKTFKPTNQYDVNICSVITSENCVTINVVSNDNSVLIGNVQTATIDVQDMENLKGLISTSPSAALFHETIEQSLIQSSSFRPNDENRVIRAHSSAENMEHNLSGNPGVSNILNIDETNGNGTLEFYKDNKLIESVKIENNNVVKQ